MKNPYLKTDKTIAYLMKQYAKLFRRVTAFDELKKISLLEKDSLVKNLRTANILQNLLKILWDCTQPKYGTQESLKIYYQYQ